MFCSIIVPTYNTDPERLDALVASIDAQTLGTDDFELLFVDDGSTTDIVARLHEIAGARSNIRVIELENSGWACRPRNQGTLAARGDWVLYMDHDDVIYPEALARLKHFTTDLAADVVNPKEVRTKPWSWGWDVFVEDRPTTVDEGPLAFLPMTPHKLYRRSFLIENQIAFIEDRRVLWEDVFFNVLAYSRGARVAIFSSYPIYHWVQTGKNTSSTFGRNRDEMWGTIRRLLEFFNEVLTDQADIDGLTLHWFRTRILKFVGTLEERSHAVESDFVQARAIANDLVPERLDALLDPLHNLMAKLLRANDHDGVRRLAESTARYNTRTTAESFAWDGDALTFQVSTDFFDNEEQLLFPIVGDRVLLPVPDGLTALGGIDITDGLTSAEMHLSVRGVSTRESTKLTAATPIGIESSGANAVPTAHMLGRVPIPQVVSNRARPDQRWDIAARVKIPGHTTHRAIRIPDDSFETKYGMIDGRYVAALRGKEMQLTVAVDTEAATFMNFFEKDHPVQAVTEASRTFVEIRLPWVHSHGAGVPVEFTITPVGDDGETQVRPKTKLAGAFHSVDGGSVIRSDSFATARGKYRVNVVIGKFKKRLALMTVEKTLRQRIAATLVARFSRSKR